MKQNRIHMIAHANPLGPDVLRFGLEDVDEYVAFVRRQLPDSMKLTCDMKLLRVEEDPWHAGRHDDAARVKDIQGALADKKTLAIVAASGGAYFSRILPHIKFDVLSSRREPLWVLGFSEMSPLVGIVAGYRCGRALYWLCPNWAGYRIRPPEAARAALGEFWRVLPDVLAERKPAVVQHLSFEPVMGEVVAGRPRGGKVRIVGGCLAVLAALVGSPHAKRLRPDGRWLMLEDIKESPYRIDRHLAALKHAGWLDKPAGLLIGDFHMMNTDTQPAVIELLKYHLPATRKIPVVTTRAIGHVWPMTPVRLNHPVEMNVRAGRVTIQACGLE